MSTYFVTRHAGAVDWARRRGIDATMKAHLDLEQVRPGDTVLGTLPVHLAAQVNERGGRYLHLELNVPEAARGAEWSAEDMERFGAELVEYRIARVS